MRVLSQAALASSSLEQASILRIVGQRTLEGPIHNEGAKNAALPALAATILSENESTLANIPTCQDVVDMTALLRGLGSSILYEDDSVIVVPGRAAHSDVLGTEARRIRASFLLAGPLLARHGSVRIAFPGGCDIGTRAIDVHLAGLSAMGATWSSPVDGILHLSAPRLSGAEITLRCPSVGATLNLMMSATLADGETLLHNAAREPEIVDVAEFLRAMGARIRGAGTSTITVQGSVLGRQASHHMMPDRIAAMTYLAAGAICGNGLVVENACVEHMALPLATLREMGVAVQRHGSGLVVSSADIVCTDLATGPYPEFSTDMQPIFAALMAQAKGTGTIHETVFDDRYGYKGEMTRMGAHMTIADGVLTIRGKKLRSANVAAADIRGGAALILAALSAPGASSIRGYHHVKRGYGQLATKLVEVGAGIRAAERWV